MVSQAIAEHHLQKLQAKLRRDAERGDIAAIDRDVRRIDKLNYCIAMDEWLIRWNLRQYPDFYPPTRIDALSRAVIAEFTGPGPAPYPPQSVPSSGRMAVAPMISITIVNAEPGGAGIAFAVDGIAHEVIPDSRLDLTVAANSIITYDGGGSLGKRRYRISPGLYEFRSTAQGLALYKVSGKT
jgi:hypothetical protein